MRFEEIAAALDGDDAPSFSRAELRGFAAALRALDGPVNVTIVVEGGVVQGVYSDRTLGVFVADLDVLESCAADADGACADDEPEAEREEHGRVRAIFRAMHTFRLTLQENAALEGDDDEPCGKCAHPFAEHEERLDNPEGFSLPCSHASCGCLHFQSRWQIARGEQDAGVVVGVLIGEGGIDAVRASVPARMQTVDLRELFDCDGGFSGPCGRGEDPSLRERHARVRAAAAAYERLAFAMA